MRRSVRFWRDVVPLVGVVVRETGVSVNALVNNAVLVYLGEGGRSEELRLRCRLAGLLREERDLMQTGRVVLRSGAFLDSYAAKLVEGDERLAAELGRRPLEALAGKKEVGVIKRLLARREAVVQEILSIQEKLLPSDEYVLKGERSQLREASGNNETVEEKVKG